MLNLSYRGFELVVCVEVENDGVTGGLIVSIEKCNDNQTKLSQLAIWIEILLCLNINLQNNRVTPNLSNVIAFVTKVNEEK